MRKLFIIITTVVIGLNALATSAAVQAQTNGPAAVIRGAIDALNAGDVDAALAFMAEDAVITLLPPPEAQGVYVGKDAIRGWWEQFTSRHGQAELLDLQVWGETAAWRARVSEDFFTGLGLTGVEFNGVGIVQGGLVKSWSWSMTDAALAQLAAATTQATNQAVAQRYIAELWNQGKVAVADEILAPDFVDHTPRPGMGTDRAALKEDIAGFYAQLSGEGEPLRVDDMVVTADRVVLRGALMLPPQDGSSKTRTEGPSFIVILVMKEGKITERWATFISWGE